MAKVQRSLTCVAGNPAIVLWLESSAIEGGVAEHELLGKNEMPITYTIGREKGLIHESWTGVVSADDLAAHWRCIVVDPEVMAIRRTVVDISASVINFRGTEFDELIRTIVLPVLKDRKWITAIVVGSPTQFGVSRQYQVFADCYSQDSIFATMEEAVKWITSPESGEC